MYEVPQLIVPLILAPLVEIQVSEYEFAILSALLLISCELQMVPGTCIKRDKYQAVYSEK